MEKQAVRLVCKSADAERAKLPLTFEVVRADSRIVADRVHFGFVGLLDREFYPFVLRRDGAVDYGGYGDQDISRTNILDKEIVEGEQFTFSDLAAGTERPVDFVYSITQIVKS